MARLVLVVPRNLTSIDEAFRLIDMQMDWTRIKVPLLAPEEKPRSNSVGRRLQVDELIELMQGRLLPVFSEWHDLLIQGIQPLLDQLAGHSASSAEKNHDLARWIAAVTDVFGIGLFFRSDKGELRQVRVASVKPSRGFSTGRFQVMSTGTDRETLKRTAAWPQLVAGRHSEADYDRPIENRQFECRPFFQRLRSVELERAKIKVPLLTSEEKSRSNSVERRLQVDELIELMQERLIPIFSEWHDLLIQGIQPLLDQLAGHSASSAEKNHDLARWMAAVSDAFGIGLLFWSEKDELRQVRVASVKPSRGFPTGRFQVMSTGTNRETLKRAAAWPQLVAGRHPILGVSTIGDM